MSRAQAVALGLTAVAIAVIWTAAASFLFLLFGGLLPVYPTPWSRYTAWWLYALSGRASEIEIYLGTSGVIPVISLGLIIVSITRLRLRASQGWLYGKTGWATTQQMKSGGLTLKGRP